jgi:hypothetical protein
MKVFAFFRHAVSDYEDLGIYVRLFNKKEDAVKALNEIYEDELEYTKENDYLDWNISKNDESYEMFEGGAFTKNNSVGYIEEIEIE